MTYDEFLEKVTDLLYVDNKWEKREVFKEQLISSGINIRWITGGMGGGSCWDSEEYSHYPRDGELEPEFNELINILDEFCPNISYTKFRKLTADCVKVKTETQNDYYGNYSNYSVKSVNMEELFKFLLHNKLI